MVTLTNMQCRNIASRTNETGCTYGICTYHIYIYRQIFALSTSVELVALAPITYRPHAVHGCVKLQSKQTYGIRMYVHMVTRPVTKIPVELPTVGLVTLTLITEVYVLF